MSCPYVPSRRVRGCRPRTGRGRDIPTRSPRSPLARPGACRQSPRQRYDFLKLWQRRPGRKPASTRSSWSAEMQPRTVVPVAVRVRHVRAWSAEFLGGKHANFNMASGGATSCTIGPRAAQDPPPNCGRAGFIKLTSQPLTWGGATSPFALLPNQRAPLASAARWSRIRSAAACRTNASSARRCARRNAHWVLRRVAV